MKFYYLLFILGFFSFFTNEIFAEFPEYQTVQGQYVNDEFGFSFVLPESHKGFLYENDNPAVGKILNIQIHPEMDPEDQCCPGIHSSPVTILFESHPDLFYSTPVPFTGDIFAAFQGYNVNVQIEDIGEYQAISSTFDFERKDLQFPEPGQRIGKFYFFNTENRYISYGISATEKYYDKYIEKFETSAKSMIIKNATSIELDDIFLISDQYETKLPHNSAILPKIQTPSIIDFIYLDEQSRTIQIGVTEPNSFRSFFAINIGELLEGPYQVVFNGKPTKFEILETNSKKYLLMFYSAQGPHEINISGSSIKDIEIFPTNQTPDSPMKQFKNGISIEKIFCKDRLMLVQKYDGTPACVKSETFQKLAEREWLLKGTYVKFSLR